MDKSTSTDKLGVMLRRLRGYRAFFRRYGFLGGLILICLYPYVKAVLAGLDTDKSYARDRGWT